MEFPEAVSQEGWSAGRGYLIALGAALTLYLISVAPGVLWQDSGLAQVRVVQRDLRGPLGLALSHPLYYSVAILFQALPFADSAFKTNLVSAVFGAFTVANIALLLRRLTARWDAAAIGAISLAVAHTFWQHCSVAEVYSVSTALLSSQLLSLERYFATRRSPWLVLTYLLNGVEFSNHPLALLSVAVIGLVTLWQIFRREVSLLVLLPCALMWLLGAGLFFMVVTREALGGLGAIGALRSALVGDFGAAVFNVFPSRRLLQNSFLTIGLNFPTPLFLLVVPGIHRLRRLASGPMCATLTGLLLLHLCWALRYDVPDQYTFFIVTVMNCSILIGLGADLVLSRKRAPVFLLFCGVLMPPVVYLVLPRVADMLHLTLGLTRSIPYREEFSYFLQPWKTGYYGPRRFAEEVYTTLPPHSVVIADETSVRPLHYYRLTRTPPRAVLVIPDVRKPYGWDGADEEFLLPQIRRGTVFVVTPQNNYAPRWLLDGTYRFEPAGSLYRVVAAEPAAQSTTSSAPTSPASSPTRDD